MIIKDFCLPESVTEARDLLKRLGPEAVVIAGATSEIFLRGEQERVGVDITRLGLDGIRREGDAFAVGATTRIAALQKHHAPGWVLDEVAIRYVTQQVRNISTVGGNVARLELWADLPVALLVLGASIVIQGDAERVTECDQFFSKPPTQLVEAGDLVTSVRVPAVRPGSGFAYHKAVRANADYSTVTVAAYLEMDGPTVKLVRVAQGGDRMPVRLKAIESAIQGKRAGEAAFAAAVKSGVEGMKWFDAWGLSKDFVRNLATVHLNEVLMEAWSKAKGG